MSNSIQVSTQTLTKKANDLKSLNNKFKKEIENLKAAEKSLNTTWDGKSNDAFHKAFSQDIVQMHNFYNAIEKYASSLSEIAKQYEKAEKMNLSTASTRKYK